MLYILSDKIERHDLILSQGSAWPPTGYQCLNKKMMRKVLFFRAGQCAALSLFRVGKSHVLQNRVDFSGRNEKSLIVQGSQN